MASQFLTSRTVKLVGLGVELLVRDPVSDRGALDCLCPDVWASRLKEQVFFSVHSYPCIYIYVCMYIDIQQDFGLIMLKAK